MQVNWQRSVSGSFYIISFMSSNRESRLVLYISNIMMMILIRELKVSSELHPGDSLHNSLMAFGITGTDL